MKLAITIETVALIEDKEFLKYPSGDSYINPDIISKLLKENLDNYIPDEDVTVDSTVIKEEKDLPSGWSLDAIPFLDNEDRTIKTFLKGAIQ